MEGRRVDRGNVAKANMFFAPRQKPRDQTRTTHCHDPFCRIDYDVRQRCLQRQKTASNEYGDRNPNDAVLCSSSNFLRQHLAVRGD